MIQKVFKTLGLILLSCVFVVSGYALLSGQTYFFKAILYNFAGIEDYAIFENRVIRKSASPQPWAISNRINKIPLSPKLRSTLDSMETVAFLVVKNDSILHESYWDGYGTESISNSFSVAKSIVSILIGVALKEGSIKSIDDPVGNYLDEYRQDGKKSITIRHLLSMSSGLNWDESYASPFSMTTEAYYGTDLPKLMSKLEAVDEPYRFFRYQSGNTQLLAMILEKATGKKIAEYAERKLWQPLGMENDALWSLDKKDGNEKAYCCVNSNARDFAKIGWLYLQKGHWNGRQLIDSSYVAESTSPAPLKDPIDQSTVDYYGLHWWLIPHSNGIFYARGILGQYIFVVPEENMVIVRLGRKRGTLKDGLLEDVRIYLEETTRIF